jgi:hypothetical protein
MEKLKDRIVEWFAAQRPAGLIHHDREIAKALGVMPGSVANTLTGLVREKRVERTAPRHYRLLAGVSEESTLTRCTRELADAIGAEGGTSSWSAMIARAAAVSRAAKVVPLEVLDALDLTRSSALGVVLGRIKRLTAAEQLVSQLCDAFDAVDIPPWEPVLPRVRGLLGAESSLGEYQRALKEVAESRAHAETRLDEMHRGIKALRAVLDMLDE